MLELEKQKENSRFKYLQLFILGDNAEVYSDPTKILRDLNWTARFSNLWDSLQVAWRWPKIHPHEDILRLVPYLMVELWNIGLERRTCSPKLDQHNQANSFKS
ncbi:hypothetical protein YC2023_018773 [Brassica napus]